MEQEDAGGGELDAAETLAEGPDLGVVPHHRERLVLGDDAGQFTVDRGTGLGVELSPAALQQVVDPVTLVADVVAGVVVARRVQADRPLVRVGRHLVGVGVGLELVFQQVLLVGRVLEHAERQLDADTAQVLAVDVGHQDRVVKGLGDLEFKRELDLLAIDLLVAPAVVGIRQPAGLVQQLAGA